MGIGMVLSNARRSKQNHVYRTNNFTANDSHESVLLSAVFPSHSLYQSCFVANLHPCQLLIFDYFGTCTAIGNISHSLYFTVSFLQKNTIRGGFLVFIVGKSVGPLPVVLCSIPRYTWPWYIDSLYQLAMHLHVMDEQQYILHVSLHTIIFMWRDFKSHKIFWKLILYVVHFLFVT